MNMSAAPNGATNTAAANSIPTKHELCLALLIERGKQGINKLEAFGLYGETALNTTISELFRFYDFQFEKIREPHRHQGGGKTFFTRYILKPISLEAAIKVYDQLKARRLQPKHKRTDGSSSGGA